VGLTDAVRKELWEKRKTLPGKIVKFRYQKIGTMEAPRQPIFLGFRDGRDL
jgi:DNA ligase-1